MDTSIHKRLTIRDESVSEPTATFSLHICVERGCREHLGTKQGLSSFRELTGREARGTSDLVGQKTEEIHPSAWVIGIKATRTPEVGQSLSWLSSFLYTTGTAPQLLES